MKTPLLVDDTVLLREVIAEAASARRVAVDVESNGLYVYQQQLCTMQLAWGSSDDDSRVAIIDTLAVPFAEIVRLIESAAVIKVFHDLAFDARMLRKSGAQLAHVADTSVAATYLGFPATGLASMLAAELGVHLDKTLQKADWSRRPIDGNALKYLAGDVSNLLQLHDRLDERVQEAGIADEVATETAYRLQCALDEGENTRPPWVRIRGADQLGAPSRAALRHLADARERLAEARNVPLFRVAADKALLALATERSTSRNRLERLLGHHRHRGDDEVIRAFSLAIVQADTNVSVGDAEPVAVDFGLRDTEAAQKRRRVETRLSAWRAGEAKRRSVHAQVVLPSHCLRRVVADDLRVPEAIAAIPGLGASRAARYAHVVAQVASDADAAPD